MLKRLQLRVFRVEADADFQAAFMDYYNKRKEFAPEAMALADWNKMAEQKVSYLAYGRNLRFNTIKQEQEVNPVEIWEGIDTGKETGRNRLTKLAIHILSVVTNSAGCERAFSHMGLVHTGIRSKLGIEKVRKATMVGMDIRQMHMEAGLLRARGKRNFTSRGPPGADAESAGDDLGDIEDPLDFDELSDHLVASAASANADKDVGDDDELPGPSTSVPVPITITIPSRNPATRPLAAPRPVKVVIPLRILFKYPTESDLPSEGMNTFWKGGIQNLEKEMEVCELLSSEGEENTDEVPETLVIPA